MRTSIGLAAGEIDPMTDFTNSLPRVTWIRQESTVGKNGRNGGLCCPGAKPPSQSYGCEQNHQVK